MGMKEMGGRGQPLQCIEHGPLSAGRAASRHARTHRPRRHIVGRVMTNCPSSLRVTCESYTGALCPVTPQCGETIPSLHPTRSQEIIEKPTRELEVNGVKSSLSEGGKSSIASAFPGPLDCTPLALVVMLNGTEPFSLPYESPMTPT